MLATQLPPELQRGFAARIKALRNELGMSRQQFAERVGLSKDTIANWETRKSPSLKAILGLAAVTDLHWLCTGTVCDEQTRARFLKLNNDSEEEARRS